MHILFIVLCDIAALFSYFLFYYDFVFLTVKILHQKRVMFSSSAPPHERSTNSGMDIVLSDKSQLLIDWTVLHFSDIVSSWLGWLERRCRVCVVLNVPCLSPALTRDIFYENSTSRPS